MASDSVVDQIRQSLDIVQIIGEVVPLKRSGSNHFGICPFHSEKSPSFSVSSSKQLFHCFGCKVGGDVFEFVKRYYRWDFPQALEELARRAGVTLDENRQRKCDDREQALKLLDVAHQYFRESLYAKAGEGFRSYLVERKIPEKLWETFELGCCPADEHLWEILETKADQGSAKATRELATSLGLLGRSGGCRFRDRLLFPILDERGRVRGFGGRVLQKDQQPKYLNSPQSSVFDKSKLLYGMHLAASAVARQGYAVLVEGYLDVLALHEYGVLNVIGSMGTSLTTDQVRTLKRWTHRVISLYDGDTAGLNATQKNLALFLKDGIEAKVVILPNAKDPDAFLHDSGASPTDLKQQLRKSFQAAKPSLDFLIERHVLVEQSPQSRGARIRELVTLLDQIPDEIARTLVKRDLANRFQLPESALGKLPETGFAAASTPYPSKAAGAAQNRKNAPSMEIGDRWEQEILKFWLQRADDLRAARADWEWSEIAPYVNADSPYGQLVLKVLEKGLPFDQNSGLDWVITNDPERESTLREWAMSGVDLGEPDLKLKEIEIKGLWTGLVQRLKMEFIKRESRRIQREIEVAEEQSDQERMRALLAEKRDLGQLMKSSEGVL